MATKKTSRVAAAQKALREAQATFETVKKAQAVWSKASADWSTRTEALALSHGQIGTKQLAPLLKQLDRIIANLRSLEHQEKLALRNLGAARKQLVKVMNSADE